MKDEPATTVEEVIRILETTNDLERLVALFAEDATVESPLIPNLLKRSEGICRGRSEIRELARALMKRGRPWGGHEPPIIRENIVAIEYRDASSEAGKFYSVDIVEIRHGKIQSLRAYLGWRPFMALTGERRSA